MPNGIDLVMIEMPFVEAEPRNALEYIQDVYKGRRPPDAWRMRAATAALQFETPKLGVVAHLNDKDFSTLLEKAIARSGRVREVKQLASPQGNGHATQADWIELEDGEAS
jgi:hypothetical protein